MASNLEDVYSCIRSCVISTKERLSLSQLSKDYRMLMGENIPFRKLGFNSLEELINESDVIKLVKDRNEPYVVVKQSEKSAHITKLVSSQKTPKSRSNARLRNPSFRSQMSKTRNWRPAVNHSVNNYYGSKRPQFVLHSQFLNAPSVRSKVVIPPTSTIHQQFPSQIMPNKENAHKRVASKAGLSSEHSTINMTHFQSQVPKMGVNERLACLKIRDDNSKENHVQINATQHTNTPDMSIKKSHSNTTDPLLSTKKRLSQKMSELSQDRDSGTSSPTTDEQLTPSPSKNLEFTRTEDAVADLKLFASLYKLGDVEVNVSHMNLKRRKFFLCKIKVGQNTYTSYPKEFTVEKDAENCCCEEALADLIPKYKRRSLLISSEKDILTRIPNMLEKHRNGIWAWQLSLDYLDKYNETLPDNYIQVIDASPCVQIEKIADQYILYHCQPGDPVRLNGKGQQRTLIGSINPSSVSVPANTVHFGEDNRITCQINCILSANEIWCEQIDTEESIAFAKMFDRMQVFYQEHHKNFTTTTIIPGGYYVAKIDGIYNRVRAVHVDNEEVSCFTIDYGDEGIVKKTDIFALDRAYASSQAQAFVCRLYGLEDLYDVSSNSVSLASLVGNSCLLELAVDCPTEDHIMVLPIFMYDAETGQSINEKLLRDLTMELATPHLKQEGVTEVYVTHVESNGDVYVHVKSKGYDNLEALRKQLEEQMNTKPHANDPPIVTKANSNGKLYFLKDKSSGSWFRCSIIDWSPDGTMAQIFYVDLGQTAVITATDEKLYLLSNLNDVLSNYPYQACRVRIALDKMPKDFVNLAWKAMPKDKPILLKLLDKSEEDGVQLVKLFRRNLDEELICINESISLQMELNKKEADVRFKFKLTDLGGNINQVPSTGSLKCPPLPKIGDNQFFQVYVTVAVNPFNFFIQPMASRLQLNEMMRKLQSIYQGVQYGNLKVEDVLPGNIYASKFEDGNWYRTSVIKVINSGASVSVFFCDFGYYQTLALNQLVPLSKEFMELPYQALKAKILRLKTRNGLWRRVKSSKN
ncbi:hypothetical protein ABEB36_007716 [Hypothenemus hampei]|uniref:Tudor domain-containing protein 7 n=1 Tax=Hypothenemus hampei TaxID=57062 RepID=A0ABD1EVF7_HYPHA